MGVDLQTSYKVVETPVGPVGLFSSGSGLARVVLQPTRKALLAEACKQFPLLMETDDDQLLSVVAGQVRSYFAGTLTEFRVELDSQGLTPFAERVGLALQQVRYGNIISYGELAARSGSPRAARATGRVMANNRWPLIVPCHRVVGKRGALVGYSGGAGLVTKQWLLDFEKRPGA